MKRYTKGYSGEEVALFPSMLHVPEPSPSPSRITSSPDTSPATSFETSPEPSPKHSPELLNLPLGQHHMIDVLENELKTTKKTYSSAFTNLILRVKKLETTLKFGKARKRVRVVLSEDDEEMINDSSKQGRKVSNTEVQEKANTETEPIIEEVTPTQVIQDEESNEKGVSEVSIAGINVSTAKVRVVSTAKVLNVSTAKEPSICTAGRTVTYLRRSKEKKSRKDKGKAIMTEPKPEKKSKK
ncbi:hypothetical protein Tco_0052624 [Tanacetum coccineum]